MSYQKIRSFNFSKDFTSFTTVHAVNNIRPLDYSKTTITKKDDETVLDFVADVMALFLDGSYQFNNNNNLISFTISKIEKNYKLREAFKDWLYKDYDNSEKRKAYNNLHRQCVKDIATALMNNQFKNEFMSLKNEKYYLKNENIGWYISSLRPTSYRYVGKYNIDKAKVFTGLETQTLSNHFAIKRDNFKFVKIENKV